MMELEEIQYLKKNSQYNSVYEALYLVCVECMGREAGQMLYADAILSIYADAILSIYSGETSKKKKKKKRNVIKIGNLKYK